MKKYDPAIPRKLFWTDRIPNKLRCPLCHTKLETEYQAYMFVVQEGEETPAFVAGNDLGKFCPQCPIVVLDMKEFGKMVAETVGLDEKNSVAFIVIGIVDLDAIPEEKKRQPIGGDDNPIPVVYFVDTVERATPTQGGGKRLSGNQRRRLRKYSGR